MDHPNQTIKHDETVSNLLIVSLILFTVFTSILLIGFF